MTPSDEELVDRARAGDVRAFEALLDRYQSQVLRILGYLGISADDRDDVAQEVFIRVFRYLDGFDSRRAFGGWIYRMTVNAAHDHRTRHGRRLKDEAPWSEGLDRPDDAPDPAESAREEELRRRLDEALLTLSERERVVFVLRELEGLETKEVARALGITQITVRRHFGRARRHLKAALEEEKHAEPRFGVERIAPDGGR